MEGVRFREFANVGLFKKVDGRREGCSESLNVNNFESYICLRVLARGKSDG